MGKTVLILGGGTAGVVAANVLKKVLPKEHHVALVDRRENHLFLASLPLVVVGRRNPQQIERQLKKLEGPNLQVVQAEVQGFNPDENTVDTDQGPLSFDSLIIALGAEQFMDVSGAKTIAYNPYNLQNALELQQELQRFKEGHIVLFVSSLPFTGAIAPYEIPLLLASYFQKRGLSTKITITLITSETRPFSFARSEISDKMTTIMEEQGINVVTDKKVLALNQNGVLQLEQGEIQGNLFIGIPQHRGPTPFRDSIIAGPEGWLEADPHSQETCLPNVYAVGDALGIKTTTGHWIPKVGFFAHYEAEVVARNIALKYANKRPRFKFVGGASGASMLTGFHSGSFVSLDSYASPPKMNLSRPNPLAFLTKTLFEKYWLSRWF